MASRLVSGGVVNCKFRYQADDFQKLSMANDT